MSETAADRGEFPGCGPEWACDKYGVTDHDYYTCPDCSERFGTYMAAKADLVTLGLLPLG